MSDFLAILDNHRELLEERGYDEIGLGSPDRPGLYMQRLEYHFSNCIGKSMHHKENQDFFIETVGFFDNDNDLVRFKFHYEFDPLKKDIDLKSFSARMDDIKQTFFLTRNMYELPHASKVHRALCNERQMRPARELVNHRPESKGQRL